MRKIGMLALCAMLGGCVTAGETVSFRASNPQQQALMRDGQPALVDEKTLRDFPCSLAQTLHIPQKVYKLSVPSVPDRGEYFDD